MKFRSLHSSLRVRPSLVGGAIAFTVALALHVSAADTARHGRNETALDRYVAQPDSSYSWKKVAEYHEAGATSYVIDLVSQNWLTPTEVNRTEWRHWLLIVKPDELTSPTGLLQIGGGANRPGQPPDRPTRDLVETAVATHAVVASLRMIPNQALEFYGDGKARQEDDLIAYTWDKFLRTGDERWPARLPMTKAAVRAMDATMAFLASDEGGRSRVETFIVSGLSKRGWTTWTTAAVDRRVIAICPIVIGVLNVEASMEHHYRAYGFFAPAVGNYVEHHIMDWSGTPESKALYAIEDPFSYRDRLAMPKLMINACGDQFFVPDSSQLFFAGLPGVKYLRYVPNTDHSLRNSDYAETLRAWQLAIVRGLPLPEFSWARDAGGRLTITAKTKPKTVLLWQATNPAARDFRLETLGPVWKSSPVEGAGEVYAAAVAKPEKGWTASFAEMTFDIGAGVPLKLTTDVAITPDELPFPAPKLSKPKGFLQASTAGLP